MLADREAERERVRSRLSAPLPTGPNVVPHPALIELYERKVATLREALNDAVVRTDAIAALRGLVGSVTVHVNAERRVSLEVEASTSTLIDFAQNAKSRRRSAGELSVEVVAGTGFEPVTFRL